MKKAIVLGATSGIGWALARLLSEKGFSVGLAGRRQELFEDLKQQLPGPSHFKRIDFLEQEQAVSRFKELAQEMGDVDLVVISSGVGFLNPDLEWSKEKETIGVNVSGFTALAGEAYRMFKEQGYGHLAGITSIAALLGGPDAPAYNASKAYMSNYLKGLRQKIRKEGPKLYITDIMPGFVDTAMAQGNLFWVASPEKAAKQIYRAILKRKKRVYITKRWRLVAWALKLMLWS